MEKAAMRRRLDPYRRVYNYGKEENNENTYRYASIIEQAFAKIKDGKYVLAGEKRKIQIL